VQRVRFTGRVLIRLLVPYTLLIVAGFSVAGWLFYRTAASSLDESLGTRLVGYAKVVAGQLNPYYLQALGPGAEDSRVFKMLKRDVATNRVAAGVDDVFVIDRAGRVLLDLNQETRIGEPYLFMKLDAVELERVWNGESVASTLYTDDTGALYKSGYTPVRDAKGNIIAAVGVEAGADFLAAMGRLKRDVIYLVLAAMALTVLISLAVSRSIVSPLQAMVSAFGRVRRAGAYPEVPVTTRDELGYLAQSFNEMIGRLKEKDTELQRLYELERERAERIQGLSDLVLEGVPNGVVAVDLAARVLLCNRAAARILSLGPEPLPETGIPPGAAEVLGDDSPVTRLLMSSLTEKKEYLREDMHWRTADGHDRVLGISSFPLADRDDNPFGAIAIFSDLTELTLLQDQIKIQERLAALGELSAGIAHEIRNPLAAIRGFVELLGRKVPDPPGKRTVANILKEIAGLDQIVSDFLAFARESALQPVETDPGELVREAVALALPRDERDALEVRVEVTSGLPPVFLDPGAVKQVLINIIQNAAIAMGPDGGTLTIRVDAANGGTAFRIADTGPGIPADIRDRIFNPFFTTRADGTGLGLAIANKLVEGHGGRIQVENGDGGGATFTLWFPHNAAAMTARGRDKVGDAT
jgi:signal transduction histidine kinase